FDLGVQLRFGKTEQTEIRHGLEIGNTNKSDPLSTRCVSAGVEEIARSPAEALREVGRKREDRTAPLDVSHRFTLRRERHRGMTQRVKVIVTRIDWHSNLRRRAFIPICAIGQSKLPLTGLR